MKKRSTVEWCCGTASLTNSITENGESYQPDILIWMNEKGTLIDHLAVKPGQLPAQICEHLRGAIAAHAPSPSRTPTRIRVNAAPLAAALRAGHPNLEIIHAATPELDEALAALQNVLTVEATTAASYLTDAVNEAQTAAFFRAAAGLFRTAPWQAVPSDTALISVTIEALGIHDQALSIIGQEDMSRGVLLFAGLDQFDAYLDASYALRQGAEPSFPPHHVLNYNRGADIPPQMRKEIAEHQWDVAGADAYPWLLSIDPTLTALEVTARELLIIETIALGLTALSSEPAVLGMAWMDEPISRTLSVPTHQGPLEITLRAPYSVAGMQQRASGTISDLFEYTRLGGTLELTEREALQTELIEQFLVSPEARDLRGDSIVAVIAQLAEDYVDATLATLQPFDLANIVFELMPRKLSASPSEARSIIVELRCLFAFMKRAYGHTRADACLRVLGGDAVSRLKAALSDPSNFGLAKSLLMSGAEAGFEVDTQEGLDAWVREVNGDPSPGSIPSPKPATRAAKNATRAAKKKREAVKKAIKKARRKNRKK